MDEINFQNQNFFRVLGFPVWGCCHLVGSDCQEANLRSVHFPLVLLVCMLHQNFFLSVERGIPEVLPFSALALPSLETSDFYMNSRVGYTQIYVFVSK